MLSFCFVIYLQLVYASRGQIYHVDFEEEKTFRSHLQNARFVKGKHEYFPIPQSVIDICGAEVMKQNPGY